MNRLGCIGLFIIFAVFVVAGTAAIIAIRDICEAIPGG